ncbi:autophagy-related protein 17 [Mycena galopus ATCC 62051]|nr:autophagy-related protein 17 [Mycena galopus ATCC 62051]
MASPPTFKALQSGEQLCSRANDVSNASAQAAVDVLALDAKVRWLTDGVLEQLRLAASIAKSIEDKRARLGRQVQEWDVVREKHSNALDGILESLGSQLVPPDFHQHSSASSLFGSQHSEDERKPLRMVSFTAPQSLVHRPQRAEREKPRRSSNVENSARFVDDQAVEDVLDKMESERTTLDSLPDVPPLPAMDRLLTAQDGKITVMARHLESLAAHYDQMAGALNDIESAGETFSEEDLQAMNRDTEELPSIMKELENRIISNSQEDSKKNLAHLHTILDDLDELGEIMTEMLQMQDTVEIECEEQLASLQQHLLTVEHLHQRYVSYRTAFNKLMLEIARRRQYREAAENIVRGMMSQLAAMTDAWGASPEDICLCIGNSPTRWEVVPWHGEEAEVLPQIDPDLIAQAKDRLASNAASATESL